MNDAINGWLPPVIIETENYEQKGRVVSQVDVDRWIAIERNYHRLVRVLGEARGIIGDDA